MAYSCQFCGEIEEGEVGFRCGECGGVDIIRSAASMSCRECAKAEIIPVCPSCGSEELEQ